jgi:hypothetical protein
MTKRTGRLFLLALLVSGLSVYFSCSQPDDIMIPVSRTELHLWGKEVVPGTSNLKPQCLPTNPKGMIYELWVANDQETLSLGKFGYRQFPKLTFQDENGNLRPDSNYFVLEADIYKYSHIFVSVERNPDPEPLVPGPIMLIDEVTDPKNDLIELRFPLSDSLWFATTKFNMETPSDDDRNAYDGYGIWFSAYSTKPDSTRDTLWLDSFKLVTKEDTLGIDTVTEYLVDIDSIWSKDTTRVIGWDTVTYSVVRFDSVIGFDSTDPHTVMDYFNTIYYYDTGAVKTYTYDVFTQDKYGLPDYSSFGWKYKGWVVSPEVPVNCGQITVPAYFINMNPTDSLIPGIEGGLLTTGTFTEIDAPDDGNPYSLGPRVPLFPGEDFLQNLPGGLQAPPQGSWGGLLPYSTGNSGTVFITLEPFNFVTDTTNFPLFVFAKPLPKNRSDIEDYEVLRNFDMKNLTETSNGTAEGFPLIVVDIQRR